MSILFTLKGELDRRLYWIQMRQEALRFISGYRRNNIIDISFPEKGFNRWSGQGPFVSRLPLPLIVGAVVCKLRGFEAKRQQIKNILHRQRSSLFIFIFITFSILPFRQNPHVVYWHIVKLVNNGYSCWCFYNSCVASTAISEVSLTCDWPSILIVIGWPFRLSFILRTDFELRQHKGSHQVLCARETGFICGWSVPGNSLYKGSPIPLVQKGFEGPGTWIQ